MDAGLKVRLNPDGGNQLNFREALRLYLAPLEQPEQQPEDDDYDEENGENEPRKHVLDDYDYDDDFIDDGEVFEDEVAGTPPNEQQDPGSAANNPQEAGKVLEKPPAHHGFANFWLNKGSLAPKRETVTPQPPSALGNVVLENVKIPFNANHSPKGPAPPSAPQPAKPNQDKPAAKKPGDASQKLTAPGQAAPPSDASKRPKPNQTNTTSGTSTSKANNPRPSQAKGKAVQHSVIEEISKLSALCQKEFGDKKPKLSDPKVQEQLHVMFRAAMAANVGKLFSDIAKDRRVVALADEVWNRLSFLRVKRANLETLGHALIWSAKEKAAIATVEKTESELDRFMRERRAKAAGAEGALMAVVFDNEVDTRIYNWYRAKSELQMAKNQLGSRVKSVKKCVGGWVVSLKKTAFQGWSVAEGEIVEAFRRVEDVKNAAEKHRREMEKQQRELERQRRENEKVEKKRKREEQGAASGGVKRVAVEKGGNAGGGPSGVTAVKAKAKATTGGGKNVLQSSKNGLQSSKNVLQGGKNVIQGGKNVLQGGVVKPVKPVKKDVKKDAKSDSKGSGTKGVHKKVQAKKKDATKTTWNTATVANASAKSPDDTKTKVKSEKPDKEGAPRKDDVETEVIELD